MSKQRKQPPEVSIFANNPFLEELLALRDSPEDEQLIEVSDTLWDLLEDVQLDARQRKFIWPDAERLDLEQSVQRIQKQYSDFPPERWVSDHLRRAKPRKKERELATLEATGQWTKIDYLKMQPPGARDHGSYGVAADSQNNFYGLEINADFIIRVDRNTVIPTYYQTPTANSGPRRGHLDNQDRLWFAENRGQNIGMFDAKAERFQEWKVPTPYAMPYDAIFDNSTYAWTGGMGNDHVSRLNVKTGEIVNYLLPSKTNIRRVDVDKSVNPSQLWVGNNHGAAVIRVEPLEP